MQKMNPHFRLMLVILIVIILGELTLRLLLPWITYNRLFFACAMAFFLASAILLIIAWRVRAKVVSEDNAGVRIRLIQAAFFFCAGIATLAFSHWAGPQ
jgi:hypothetical protein